MKYHFKWFQYSVRQITRLFLCVCYFQIVATQSDTDLHICDDPDLGPFFGSLEHPSLRLFCKVYGSKSAKVVSIEGCFAFQLWIIFSELRHRLATFAIIFYYVLTAIEKNTNEHRWLRILSFVGLQLFY